jgi:MoaA/NifB/PqqE/SkfB family radical SAM enzyme
MLHIELTNRCVLGCPACPRTQWEEILKRPVEKTDLDYHDLAKFLDCEQGKKINSFLLCGDYGDTIYYPHLFDFLQYFRDNKSYHIHTNGSYRNKDFWLKLADTLTDQDTITFSIDGLEDTNHVYRINSNWNSIMLGLDIMSASKTKVIWKTIIFQHNYKQLAEIKKIALDKGCKFTAEKAHRFGNTDFEPPSEFVESNHVYQEIFNHDHSIEIHPSCTKEKTVSCDGYLYPCDWIRNPRTLYKSQLWKQKDNWLSKLNIKHTNYDEASTVVESWANWVRESSLAHSPLVDVLCRMKCRNGCQQNRYIEV